MRPGQQQNKRGRGRGNNNNNGGGGGGNNFNRKGQNPLTRTYDSSGPDVKIRGTAQHIAEKYSTLGRDAMSSGDRVIAENYLQHAEHYNRIIAAAQAQMQERFQNQDRQDYNGQDDRDGDDFEGNDYDDNMGAQPVIEQQPRENRDGNRDQGRENNQNRNRDDRGNRGDRQDRGNRDNRGERQDRDNRGNRPERNAESVAETKAETAPEGVAPEAATEVDDQPRVETRERRPRREPRQPREQAPAAAADVNDGSGPQPVIEGVPAEVAAEEAEATATPRRRAAAARPRRQPRKTAESGEGDAAGEAKTELADVAGE